MKKNKVLLVILMLAGLQGCKDTVVSVSSDSVSSESLSSLSSSSVSSSSSSSSSSASIDPTGAAFPSTFTDEQKTYYKGVEGLKGTALKTKLHEIINTGFTGISYGDARDALKNVDEDPEDSTRVIEIYTRYSVLKTDSLFGNNDGFWNREHCYPQSRMNTKVSSNDIGRGTDIHMLHASDGTTNGKRSNLNYFDFAVMNSNNYAYTVYKCRDASGKATTANSNCRYNTSLGFEPDDEGKGDSARSVLYMAVMYPDYCTLSNTDSQSSSTELGRLDVVLDWNKKDLPDSFEEGRNEKVYDNYQHNRNPFVDAPEWADLIFA